jgi:hypothetical protein
MEAFEEECELGAEGAHDRYTPKTCEKGKKYPLHIQQEAVHRREAQSSYQGKKSKRSLSGVSTTLLRR